MIPWWNVCLEWAEAGFKLPISYTKNEYSYLNWNKKPQTDKKGSNKKKLNNLIKTKKHLFHKRTQKTNTYIKKPIKILS